MGFSQKPTEFQKITKLEHKSKLALAHFNGPLIFQLFKFQVRLT